MTFSLLKTLVASSGGRIVLSAPSISVGTSAGQFIINNFDSSLIYTVTSSVGSSSRSGNIITISPTTATATVTRRTSKGINSPAITLQRQPVTFYSCNCGVRDSFQVGGCCCPGGYNYEDYGWVKYCRLYGCDSCENSPPSGWTKTNGEWSRVA